MFDKERPLPKPTQETKPSGGLLIDKMSVQELIRLRDQITRRLPPLTIAEMDLEEEMLLQFHALRATQNDVMGDLDIPVNQQAQIANACGQQLKALAERQSEIYTSERIKRLEKTLIRLLHKWDSKQAELFLEEYEKELENL